MSYDYVVVQKCDHIFFDFFELEEDRQLFLEIPFLASEKVDVYYNRRRLSRDSYYIRNHKRRDISGTLIIFKDYRRESSSTYKVKISTVRGSCPKCGGSDVTLELRPLGNGEIEKLENGSHLRQQFLLYLREKFNSNPFYYDLGSKLKDAIGSSGVNVSSEIFRVYREYFRVRSNYDDIINNRDRSDYFDIKNIVSSEKEADSRVLNFKIITSKGDISSFV